MQAKSSVRQLRSKAIWSMIVLEVARRHEIQLDDDHEQGPRDPSKS